MKFVFHRLRPVGGILVLVNKRKVVIAFGFGLVWLADSFIKRLGFFFDFYWKSDIALISKKLVIWKEKVGKFDRV